MITCARWWKKPVGCMADSGSERAADLWAMSGEFYPIIPIAPAWVRAEEQMGSKTKYWVDLPDRSDQWLFKYTRKNVWGFAGEHWSEKIAAEVAALIDLPHAEVELATLQGHPGALSRKFPELNNPGTALVHGNVLMPLLVHGYDADKRYGQSDHTLVNILRVIGEHFPDKAEQHRALDQFMGLLVLDALVMNTDRHHENWAMIRHTSVFGVDSHHMAPSFDHASSLGRELTEKKIEGWEHDPVNVLRYVNRARGPIYRLNKDVEGLNPMDVLALALRVKPEHVHPWLVRMHTLVPQALVDIVARVPPTLMSVRHKNFAAALLRHTLSRIQHLRT